MKNNFVGNVMEKPNRKADPSVEMRFCAFSKVIQFAGFL